MKAVWIGVVCAFLTGVVAFCGLTLATVGTVAEADGSFEGLVQELVEEVVEVTITAEEFS